MTTAPLSPAQIDYVTVFHRRLAVLLAAFLVYLSFQW